MMEKNDLIENAAGWIKAWNEQDIPKLMLHYSDDVVFFSSAAELRWNAQGGKLSGKDAVEKHFRRAFELVPGMKVEFKNLLPGAQGFLLMYERETGAIAADYILFNESGKVKEVRVFTEYEIQ